MTKKPRGQKLRIKMHECCVTNGKPTTTSDALLAQSKRAKRSRRPAENRNWADFAMRGIGGRDY